MGQTVKINTSGQTVKIKINVDLKKAGERKLTNSVRLFATADAFRLMSPYVPMQTGTLWQTVDISPGKIHYKMPYADRMYNGDGLHFSKEEHALATAHWDRAMMRDKGDVLARDVTRFLKYVRRHI
ncbi:MAG: minor capsid protein [Eubacteriales bacterium]